MELPRADFTAKHTSDNIKNLLLEIKLIHNVRHVEETNHELIGKNPVPKKIHDEIKGEALLISKNETTQLERDLKNAGLGDIDIQVSVPEKSNWEKYGFQITVGFGAFSSIATALIIYAIDNVSKINGT